MVKIDFSFIFYPKIGFVLTTMKTVSLSVQRVLDIRGFSGSGTSTRCSDFLASLQIYFKMLSQGKFAQEDIFAISSRIITSSPRVRAECSSREKYAAGSILKSIKNYQFLFTSNLVSLQMKLMQIIKVQVTSLQITFAGINEQGSLTQYEAGVACQAKNKPFYRQKITQYTNSIDNIQDLCNYVDYVSELIDAELSGTSRLASNNLTSSTDFLQMLGQLLYDLSRDVSGLEADDVLAIRSIHNRL